MNRVLIACGVLIACASMGAERLQAQARAVGSQQADVHNPFSPNYLPLLPHQPIRGLGNSPGVSGPRVSTFTYFYGGSPFYYSGYYDYLPPYGYYPYSPYSYGSYPYPYPYGVYSVPPAVLPAETLYGPRAMQRFLGVDARAAPRAAREPREAAGNLEAPKAKVRETGAESKDQASKWIDAGDLLFVQQKYQSALARYRAAVQKAPDLAESYFREGHALVALAQFAAAGKAFRRGLDIGPDWLESGFRLDRLYGDGKIAKSAHLEALAAAAEKNPQDSNLFFLLGVQLYLDGQPGRARMFFEHSAELGGNRDRLLDAFLLAPAAKQPALQPGHIEF